MALTTGSKLESVSRPPDGARIQGSCSAGDWVSIQYITRDGCEVDEQSAVLLQYLKSNITLAQGGFESWASVMQKKVQTF